MQKLPVWKVVRIGMYNSEGYRHEMHSKGIRLNQWASHMLEHVTMYPCVRHLQLVKIDVRKELGVRPNTSFGDICWRAIDAGLDICPIEVGAALRLCYLNQPHNEWLRIAMPSIKVDKKHDPGIFRIDHGQVGSEPDGLWLRASNGGVRRTWVTEDEQSNHGAEWVFVKPQH